MGQIYTDKNITSGQPWQSENSPGELSAHEELTNSTPALPEVPNQGRGGVLGRAWCINDTCVVLGSPSYPVLPLTGPQLGAVSQAAVLLTGDEVQPSSSWGNG